MSAAVRGGAAEAQVLSGAWWSTSSFGELPVSSPQELSTLGEHLHGCRGGGGRLFAVACGAESVHRFIASRVVTTLVIAAGLVAAATLLAT